MFCQQYRSGGPVKELLYELQVHQIELEMQNKELRSTQTALEEARDQYVELYEFAPVGYPRVDQFDPLNNAKYRIWSDCGPSNPHSS